MLGEILWDIDYGTGILSFDIAVNFQSDSPAIYANQKIFSPLMIGSPDHLALIYISLIYL
jgi:hypothetical protein